MLIRRTDLQKDSLTSSVLCSASKKRGFGNDTTKKEKVMVLSCITIRCLAYISVCALSIYVRIYVYVYRSKIQGHFHAVSPYLGFGQKSCQTLCSMPASHSGTFMYKLNVDWSYTGSLEFYFSDRYCVNLFKICLHIWLFMTISSINEFSLKISGIFLPE